LNSRSIRGDDKKSEKKGEGRNFATAPSHSLSSLITGTQVVVREGVIGGEGGERRKKKGECKARIVFSFLLYIFFTSLALILDLRRVDGKGGEKKRGSKQEAVFFSLNFPFFLILVMRITEFVGRTGHWQ